MIQHQRAITTVADSHHRNHVASKNLAMEGTAAPRCSYGFQPVRGLGSAPRAQGFSS